MATVIILKTGHQYRVADALTLEGVNDALNGSSDRFLEVPLAPNAAAGAGTPGEGQAIQHLFITPDSVSHFVVI